MEKKMHDDMVQRTAEPAQAGSVRWTPEQAEAITRRGQNLLVAAAAGSGKTAVLVERIKRLILEERCPIDRMLIVTFTNAAAAEMKEKIEKAIRKEIEGAAKQDLAFLKKQLDLLPNANISTFHAFALEVIRRYFFIIDAEPNFKICDNSRQQILRGQAMDELLEEFFAENTPEFYEFLRAYSGERNENRFRQMIMQTFDTIQSLPEPEAWLHEKVEELNPARGSSAFADDPAMNELWEDVAVRIAQAEAALQETKAFATLHNLAGILELTQSDCAMAEELKQFAEARDFDGMTARLDGFRLKALSKKIFAPTQELDESAMADVHDMVEQNRSALKNCVKEFKNSYFYDSFAQIAEDVFAGYPSARFFKHALRRYSEIYAEKKREKGLVDFNDIEHFAYEILKDEQAAAFYREKFIHIFVDEYQDSNVIQEALIERLQNGRNLFTVGDIKQSIYMFRLAEPQIFKARYRKYDEEAKEKGQDSASCSIDLNRNFRSKTGIIHFINEIFFRLMDDYDERAALYPGDPFAEKCTANPVLYLAQTPWDETEEVDEELKSLLKAEKEALAAVKIIREHLGKTIYDSKAQKERPLQKKDIVILTRGMKNYGDLFYKILTENNLPAYVDDNDGFFDTIEINTFMSLLALLENPKQDIPLLTVLRSEIFHFSIEELTAVRIAQKEGSYYQAVAACAGYTETEAGTCDPALGEKCRHALQSLQTWTKLAGLLPLDELVWELMLHTGFYVAMGAMPGGSQRQANLRALVDKAHAYQGGQDGSLYGFMEYIDAVKAHKVSMGQVKMVGEDEDIIRIMTIHKSKGLEFPMVLLTGYCRRLNYTTTGKGPALHKSIGLGFPVVNYQESWYRTSIIQNVIRTKIRREEAEEEKRILYVAMTRAKDILCLLGIEDHPAEAISAALRELPKDSSYFTMTAKTICRHVGGYRLLTNAELAGLSKGRKRAVANVRGLLDHMDTKTDETLHARMTFCYPYTQDLNIKSKYAVSELTQMRVGNQTVFVSRSAVFAEQNDVNPVGETEESKKSADPGSLAEPASFHAGTDFTPAQVGTFTHKVLEKLDFHKEPSAYTAYVRTLLAQMIADEFLTSDEAASVDAEKIAAFAVSPLGRRIAASPRVRREQPFNLMMEVDGSMAAVQGIIDCFFEEDGQLVLIDYKTTQIESADELARRTPQLRKTYAAQMEIYRRALEAATGMQVRETYLYLTNLGETVRM